MKKFLAFNPVAHNFLVASGYVDYRLEATWEDVGDAENGPKLEGGPACDVYEWSGPGRPDADEDHRVLIDENGRVHFELVMDDGPDPSDIPLGDAKVGTYLTEAEAAKRLKLVRR